MNILVSLGKTGKTKTENESANIQVRVDFDFVLNPFETNWNKSFPDTNIDPAGLGQFFEDGSETWHKYSVKHCGFFGKCKQIAFLFTNHEIANSSKTSRSIVDCRKF